MKIVGPYTNIHQWYDFSKKKYPLCVQCNKEIIHGYAAPVCSGECLRKWDEGRHPKGAFGQWEVTLEEYLILVRTEYERS